MESRPVQAFLFRGAWHGMTTGLAYATVEYGVIAFLEPLIHPPYLFQPHHWRVNFIVIGLLAVLAALAGFLMQLASCFLRKRLSRMSQQVLTQQALLIMLAVTVVLTLAYQEADARVTLFASGLGAVCVAGSAARLLRPHWVTKLGLPSGPWSVSTFLLVPLWVLFTLLEDREPVWRGLAAIAASFLVLALTRLWNGVRRKPDWLPWALVAVFPMSALVEAGSPGHGIRSSPSFSPRPGPVILIVLDSVRADHLSVYGYHRKTSPNLELLASRATLYRHAVAPSNYTLPSHASLLTGLYPTRHGAHYVDQLPAGRPLSPRVQTLAEVLRSRGYRTAAVVANYGYLSASFGLAQGFEQYEALRWLPLGRLAWPFCLRAALHPAISRLCPERGSGIGLRDAEDINRSVLSLMKEFAGEPFFLFVNYMDTHWPYQSPEPYQSLFHRAAEPFDWRRFWTLEKEVVTGRRQLTETERTSLISLYDGAIRYLDAHLGALFQKLKESGLYDSSLLIITSDHGDAFGEHSLLSHGASLYEAEVHVPLIIKYPQQKAPDSVLSTVSLVDVFTTVLDSLGLPTPATDGRSLRTVTKDNKWFVFSEGYPHIHFVNLDSRFKKLQRAVYWHRYKLVSSSDGSRELFDLESDPTETVNLYKRMPDISEKLMEILDQWAKKLRGPVTTPVPSSTDLQRLRSLGYIQSR